MKNKTKNLTVLLLLCCAPLVTALADKPPAQVIDAIEFQYIDQKTNKVTPFDKLPDPYGDGVDVLVSVRVKGADPQRPTTLTLSVHGLAYADEATGKNPDRKLKRSRKVIGAAKGRWFAFVIPYLCYPDVALKASLSGSKAKPFSRNVSMACAE